MKYQIQYKHKDKTYIENMYLSTSKAISTLSAFIASTVTEIRQFIYTKSTKTKIKAIDDTVTAKLRVYDVKGDCGYIIFKGVKPSLKQNELISYAKQYLSLDNNNIVKAEIMTWS